MGRQCFERVGAFPRLSLRRWLFSPLLSRRNEIQKKAACITALVYKSYYGTGKAWDLKAILAGRLQVSCLGDFLWISSFVSGDTATVMEIPQDLFIYTRHFVIVFVFSGELLLPAGLRCQRGWAVTHSELKKNKDPHLQYTFYRAFPSSLCLRSTKNFFNVECQKSLGYPGRNRKGTLLRQWHVTQFLQRALLPTPAFLLTRPQHSGNSPSPCPPDQRTVTAIISFQLLHHVSKPKANNALCSFLFVALHPRCRNKNAGFGPRNAGEGVV
ncbi:hypothetical protein BGZ57DRAFT_429567 [Hyaloscypha finlandica]|nr:hypothetical protein BGZ57DRAFT_429567 [Hyaloscypha finlandica]KAH8779256.1 hypothetical protein F5882DRAFT_150343 [Hyaloscypha sp. PMI_1271]